MARKTIRAAQFMYYIPTGRTRRDKTGQEHDVMSVRHAFRGDTVDIPREEDVERGEAAGVFVADEPEVVETDIVVEEEEEEEEEEEDTGPDFSSHDSLVWWIRNEQPTSRQVLDAAEGDPEKAEMLLAAEHEGTGGHSRKSVVNGLRRITQADEE